MAASSTNTELMSGTKSQEWVHQKPERVGAAHNCGSMLSIAMKDYSLNVKKDFNSPLETICL